jgi:hypothetical protein
MGGTHANFPDSESSIKPKGFVMSIKIAIELNQEDAWSFAEVLKRAGIDDYKRLSKTEEEAYRAMSAAEKIREALSQSGVNPR